MTFDFYSLWTNKRDDVVLLALPRPTGFQSFFWWQHPRRLFLCWEAKLRIESRSSYKAALRKATSPEEILNGNGKWSKCGEYKNVDLIQIKYSIREGDRNGLLYLVGHVARIDGQAKTIISAYDYPVPGLVPNSALEITKQAIDHVLSLHTLVVKAETPVAKPINPEP